MRYALRIPGFEDSWLWATVPDDESPSVPDTAVVFVHGFLGNAVGTWVGFPELLPRDDWWDSADLYFMTYDSFRPSLRDCAKRVSAFLKAITAPPDDWFVVPPESLHPIIRDMFPRFPLPRTGTNYRNLVLVGHSMGGLVLRESVLIRGKQYRDEVDAVRRSGAHYHVSPPPLLTATLRLFAPALFGARPAGLMSLALRLGGPRHVTQVLLGWSRSYQDMERSSGIPAEIAKQTQDTFEAFLRDNQELQGFTADVMWADGDDVVADATAYLYDREAEDNEPDGDKPRTDHRTVCKPTQDYMDPLKFVKEGTRR